MGKSYEGFIEIGNRNKEEWYLFNFINAKNLNIYFNLIVLFLVLVRKK